MGDIDDMFAVGGVPTWVAWVACSRGCVWHASMGSMGGVLAWVAW